jgi:DNA processing protein
MLGVGRGGRLGAERLEAPPGPAAIDELERRAAMLMMSIDGLGPVTFYRLLAAHRSAAAVLDLAMTEVGRRALLGSLGPGADPDHVAGARPQHLVAGLSLVAREGGTIVARLAALKVGWLTLEDPEYPARLRLLDLPPPVLFLRGAPAALAADAAVAIVGTRRATDGGRRIAARIADALARLGVAIISGLAIGIDGAAHEATIAAGGPTVAVLGSGHERLFPAAHRRLAERIVESGGALISELPPESIPTRGTFPRRNRVISGLADATIVVEAGTRSGALITAAWALEQGRECFAVPGQLDAPASADCLAFLREYPGQVRIVAGIAELIEDLGLAGGTDPRAARPAGPPSAVAPRPTAAAVLASLGPAERSVAEALLGGSAIVDDVARSARQPVATVLGALTVLELRGLVTAGGGRYRLAGVLAGAPPVQTARVASVRQPVLP